MPKKTKIFSIATKVFSIVKLYCSVEHSITISANGKIEEQYKIWDSDKSTWYYAPTLDEVFLKFKEGRGIET